MLLSLASVIVLQEFVADHYSSTQGDILILNTPTTEILVMTMSLDITVQNQECQIDEQCKSTSNSTSILTSAQVSRTNADDLGKIRERKHWSSTRRKKSSATTYVLNLPEPKPWTLFFGNPATFTVLSFHLQTHHIWRQGLITVWWPPATDRKKNSTIWLYLETPRFLDRANRAKETFDRCGHSATGQETI